jgi:hypothetical protein
MAAWPPEVIFLLACGVSAVAGFGRLLGTDAPLTIRNVAHAVLLHGTIGGCFAGVGYDYFGWKGKPLSMLGFSGLYGGGLIAPTIVARLAESAVGILKNQGKSDDDARGTGDPK